MTDRGKRTADWRRLAELAQLGQLDADGQYLLAYERELEEAGRPRWQRKPPASSVMPGVPEDELIGSPELGWARRTA